VKQLIIATLLLFSCYKPADKIVLPTEDININQITWTDKKSEKVLDKPIFVYMYLPGHDTCKFVDEFTLKDPEVVNFLNDNYISIKIDLQDRFDLIHGLKVDGVPSFLFLERPGKPILQIYGMVIPNTLMVILREVLTKRKIDDVLNRGVML
jgi:thioredoxin-related protein